MALFGAKVRRLRSGRYKVDLDSWERDLLRTLPGQLRELLDTDDPALERLFPPAYLDDDERNDEYQRLMRSDLLGGRTRALDVLEATIDATEVDEDQLVAWMGVLNDLRLVLGTRLDVSEDLDLAAMELDPDHGPAYALYGYLGYLQEWVVRALQSGL